MPVDTIYTISIEPKVDYKVMRNKIYIAKESDVKMIHCSKTQLTSLSSTIRQYLIVYLAYKISKPLNKAHLSNDLFNKMLYYKDGIQVAEFNDRISVWDEDDESYGIY